MIERRHAVAPGQLCQPDLRILLLGPPAVVWRDRPLTLNRRQSRAVLFRIAAAADRVPRDQLCFLLWPDEPDHAARRNLSNVLAHLKRALPLPGALHADREVIGLNHAVVSSDVQAFAAAAAAAARTAGGGSAQLQAAVALYRGAFLNGFSLPDSPEFDAWRDVERHDWERRFLDILATLVEAEASAGNLQAGIAATLRYLEVDPLAEAMHRRLMALYAARDDRDTALAQFARCAEALRRELGVEPMPETHALYAAIRDGRRPPDDGAAGIRRDVTTLQGRSNANARTPAAGALPAPVTPLIGRDAEVRTACALLDTGDARWLTLTGPGGAGKTRLAVELGHALGERFADGAVWVPLAPLRDPALVGHAIAQACGLAQATPERLAEYVSDKQLMLLLDNCEHVLGAMPEIAQLLTVAPRLQVLATSRAALALQGEHTFSVLPLPLPNLSRLPQLAALADVPSMALLQARIQALNPRFQLTAANAADLAAICVRLDGLPLALELAAARLRLLPPRDLLRRLDRRLPLMTGGTRDMPERQQTLRATIDWSYVLLDTAEQRLFEYLAVFSGGWSLEAAETVCAAPDRAVVAGTALPVLDGLAALVDKSLVQHRAGEGAARFGMLETIHEFAAERLLERGSGAIPQAHAAYFAAWAEALDHNAPGWIATIEGELLPEALRIQRELHATMAAGWTLLYLGMLAYRQADYLSARQHFIASLATTAQGGAQHIVPPALEGLAGVAGAWQEPVCAARLLGAAEALRDTLGLPLAPLERPNYDAICAAVRQHLAQQALRDAWRSGRNLTPAQAIAEAEAISLGAQAPE